MPDSYCGGNLQKKASINNAEPAIFAYDLILTKVPLNMAINYW
jgi:hypothetical protein